MTMADERLDGNLQRFLLHDGKSCNRVSCYIKEFKCIDINSLSYAYLKKKRLDVNNRPLKHF